MNKIIDKLETWKDIFIKNIPNIAIALVVVFIAYFASRGINNLISNTLGKKIKQESVRNLVSRVASAIIFLTGLYIAMTVLKFDDTLKAIVSAAGVSGIVIGLALQGTLSNTISGVVLSFRENLNIGNWIETNGYAGEVIDINLNYFVIKEADNNMVIIPNKTILENPFKNYSLTTKMRISIECGVGYESDLEMVEKLTLETIKSNFNQEEIGKNVSNLKVGDLVLGINLPNAFSRAVEISPNEALSLAQRTAISNRFPFPLLAASVSSFNNVVTVSWLRFAFN